uniref:hypothetical protein n=1 Tax=Parabacteroides goldsteinii TaxID=328812 RepID=UPI00259439E7
LNNRNIGKEKKTFDFFRSRARVVAVVVTLLFFTLLCVLKVCFWGVSDSETRVSGELTIVKLMLY